MKIGKLSPLLPIVAVLLVATFLRFYQLDSQSFWNDEGNSARLSERSIAKIIEGTASDIHPPLYYLILRGWRELVGDSEFGLRSFSAFAGILTVAATIAWAKFIAHRSLFVIGVLTAVAPALIYYSQEARMYSLLALLATLSSFLLFKWLNNGQMANWRLAIFYVVTATAGLYTHYSFPAVLLAQNLIVLIWLIRHRPITLSSRHPLMHWIGMMVITFTLYLPWLPVFLRKAGGGGGESAPFLPYLQDVWRWLVLGPTSGDGGTWALIAAGILFVLGIIMPIRRGVSRNALTTTFYYLLLFIIPVSFLYAIGTTRPQFFKFLTVAIPPLTILIGSSKLKIQGSERTNLQSSIFNLFQFGLVVVVLGTTAVALHALYTDPTYARADYRGIVEQIEGDDHPNAGIILDAPNQWEVFTYYYEEVDRVYPLPKGLSRPTPESIDAELTAVADQHERLYVLFWGEDQRDPERLVERWLDAHAFKATEEWIGDVRFVVYAVPDEPATDMSTAVGTPFGESIILEGYTLNDTTFSAGDILQATLFWQTAINLDQRYKVFLHLLDENGQLIAQRDAEPGGNLIPTTIWQPYETVIDNHGLLIPAGTPAGKYTLVLGLYDLVDSNGRLPTPTGDTTQLATIIIEA